MIRLPGRLPPGSTSSPPPPLYSSRLPNPAGFLGEKAKLLFFPGRARAVFARRGCWGPSGMSAARDAAGREGACRAAQSVPGARGRGGAGRVNVTAQYLYLDRCSRLPSLTPGAWTGGVRGVLGEFGSWREGTGDFTRVRPQNGVGAPRTLVTRCWEYASRGGQTSARKLLPFFLLSVFLPRDILKGTRSHKWSLGYSKLSGRRNSVSDSEDLPGGNSGRTDHLVVESWGY